MLIAGHSELLEVGGGEKKAISIKFLGARGLLSPAVAPYLKTVLFSFLA